MAAHAQNACSSSRLRNRCLPPACSCAQTLPGAACGRADERLPGRGELLARPGLPARLEQRQRVPAPLADRPGQDGQDGQAVPGAGVHPGFAPADGLAAVQVIGADRGWRDPWSPACGILQGPFGQVQVEAPDAGQHVEVAEPLHLHDGLPPAAGDRLAAGPQPLLPGGRRLAGQPERVDAGMVLLQVGPEAPGELVGAVCGEELEGAGHGRCGGC